MYNDMLRVDPLTRLLNRQTLEDEIAEELQRVERYDRFACLALIDMDDFARVNAEQGQAMGDLLLTCLAGIIADIRTIDTAGRYHGETFLLYLPETRADGAAVLTGRIHGRFRGLADTMTGLDLTFSAGVVEAPRDGCELSVLLGRAEEAIERAKKAGRKRVALWPGEVEQITELHSLESPSPSEG